MKKENYLKWDEYFMGIALLSAESWSRIHIQAWVPVLSVKIIKPYPSAITGCLWAVLTMNIRGNALLTMNLMPNIFLCLPCRA